MLVMRYMIAKCGAPYRANYCALQATTRPFGTSSYHSEAKAQPYERNRSTGANAEERGAGSRGGVHRRVIGGD
ncbi:hypothetical protein N7510_006702 [Penicillium lagena]|uniref:uncharacterized protein n=1 Tax=Penicillium lagena TaxID=94218 RepID=UPI002540DB40|nr:uncharacterized protein N7510_006702 [Penicillium lagena]KAJ5609983.1 hypothetical protein N7510_006702 [Penicillium lagena]